MPDVITWTALLVSCIVLFLMWMSGLSADAPYTFAGFAVVGLLMTIFEVIKRAAPNPYKKRIYRIKMGEYTTWLVQHPENAPAVFESKDLITAKPLAGCLVDPYGTLVTKDAPGEVMAMEANYRREGKLPARALSRVNNLEAWLYYHQQQRAERSAQ